MQVQTPTNNLIKLRAGDVVEITRNINKYHTETDTYLVVYDGCRAFLQNFKGKTRLFDEEGYHLEDLQRRIELDYRGCCTIYTSEKFKINIELI